MSSASLLYRATRTPIKAGVTAVLWVGLAIVLVNLFLNRPNHDPILGIDTLVAGVNLALAAIVFPLAARFADRPRAGAVMTVTLSILLVVTAPIYYLAVQPVLGLAAILLGSRPALRTAHPAIARTALILGGLGLVGNIAFVAATAVHFLAQ